MEEQSVSEEIQVGQDKEKIMDRYADSVWYANIVYFLLYLQFPEHLDKKAGRSLNLKATKYCLIDQQLIWKDPRGVFLRCLDKKEIKEAFSESHEGACGGHKNWKVTAYKILRFGY